MKAPQWNRTLRSIVGFTLPVLAIALFAVLLAFSLMRLGGIERDMRIEAAQNMLWVISRAHISSLNLSETAVRRSLGNADQNELQLKYNVFLSRLTLINEGPQRRQMQRLGFADQLDNLEQMTVKLKPLIAAMKPGKTDGAVIIHNLLQPYDALLGRAANAAMVTEWDDLGQRLDSYREQLWHIIASLAAISIAGGFLSIQLLLSVRETRRRTHLLQREKAFSQLLIGSSGAGIMAVDLQQRCTVWNGAMEQLFGLPADKVAGMWLGDISGFFQVEAVRHALSEAVEGRSTELPNQVYFPPRSDKPLYVDLSCFSLSNGPQIIGSIVLISDITDRHATQMEIANHRDHLEELVKARTHELDQALERERATANLYRNFAAMVSHQFRTPLAIIDSALQRLVRRKDRLAANAEAAEELVERSTTARLAIARLTQLVESTLDAARLDAGQIEVVSRACDIEQLVLMALERQKETTPERIITLKKSDHGINIARCDPTHVEHILVNLISNAVKYSCADTVIDIEFYTNNAMVYCTVTNTGQLTIATEQDKLFERYYRGKNAEGLPGIGIGLYMARTLAHMQGGDIVVSTTPQDQTCFKLSLPVFVASSIDDAVCLTAYSQG